GHLATGPRPRFLAAGGGSLYTLNQGDGTLTRIDLASRRPLATIALGTPGPGGDVAVGAGSVWTTMMGVPITATDLATDQVRRRWVGPGGDSLALTADALWLTDYHGGSVSRYALADLGAAAAAPADGCGSAVAR
ncbi:MAG: hypothetical protein JSR54_18475, partial [Proteobacteria bacterium]|nr:hypothetical protein [Pseudomonadota bacterium]